MSLNYLPLFFILNILFMPNTATAFMIFRDGLFNAAKLSDNPDHAPQGSCVRSF